MSRLVIQRRLAKNYIAFARGYRYVGLIDVACVGLTIRESDHDPVFFGARVDKMVPCARVRRSGGQPCGKPDGAPGCQARHRRTRDMSQKSYGQRADLLWANGLECV